MSDTAKLQQLNETLEALKKRKRFRSFEFFKPYKKQRDFFLLGTTCRERLLMAGNQLGKTYCGAFEMACHLTGEYPVWWMGRRFTKPMLPRLLTRTGRVFWGGLRSTSQAP